MFEFFNHNSFLLLEISLWVGVGFKLFRPGVGRRELLLFSGLTLLLLAIYFSFRPNQATSAQTAAVQAQIGAGVPVLLELQSPY